MTIEEMKTSQEAISRILEVGTYGSEWLYIEINQEQTPAKVLEEAHRLHTYSNERQAYILLHGGTLNFHDGYEEDDDEEGRPHITTITLKEWQKGIDLMQKEAKRSLAHLIAEVEDYYDANNALQVVMFGEETYG
mgnify:FL=1